MTEPLRPADLDRIQLARWVRELLMAGHLIDRAGMPQLITSYGRDVMRDVAIDEWMGASPVYTRRTQELLGFRGDVDVATMFKGMQLDVGAPPQFLDFRYTVHDDTHGEFRLAHCGALMDVEPMGEDYVEAMCHDIEDPTFPATACATDPRAVVAPVHRPPRTPADRHPHCHWTVTIEEDAPAAPEPEYAVRIAATRAGSLPVAAISDEPGAEGATDYRGPLQDDLDLEAFSAGTLRAIADEMALQGHLLVLSFWMAVADRDSAEAADEIVRQQLKGIGAIASERLRLAFDLSPDLAGLAGVLELHPLLRPRAYVGATVELDEAAGRVVVRLGECPALAETVARPWPALLAGHPDVLGAVAWGADRRAVVTELDDGAAGSGPAWAVTLGDEELPEPVEATLTRFSTGADFRFKDR
jgi:hypothetical protein